MPPVLRLGHVDAGATPSSRTEYLRTYHDWSSSRRGFRDEGDDRWRSLEQVEGGHVRGLQEQLHRAGFLPHGPIDGIFGYRTRASVRLFQEFVRAALNTPSIGTPDGVVGAKTWAHVDAWAAAGTVADWAKPGFSRTGTAALAEELLTDTLKRLAAAPDLVTRGVDSWVGPTSTLRSSAWSADTARVHLIGIRRNATIEATTRSNDDLFVLLGGGMTFFFLGSTDPNPSLSRDDEPYLVRGQHRYRFGWHKLSPLTQLSDGDAPSPRAYLALRPAVDAGVLVIRDRDRDDAISEADLRGALEANPSINIHWSGRGTSNWSAGCQVVGGARYVGYGNRVVDCTEQAAVSYSGLASGQTRGAWNVLIDALTVAAPQFGRQGTEVLYTLLYEEDLDPSRGVTPTLFRQLVERLAGRSDTPIVPPV